jgi:O-antigen/teichoic acid export membrane protein
MLGNAVQQLSNLALLVTLPRLFGRAEYGAYRQVWLIYNLLAPLLMLGIPSSLLYFIPRLEPEKGHAFVRRTTSLLAIAGASLGGAVFLVAPYIGLVFNSPSLPELLRWFSLYVLLVFPCSHVVHALIARGAQARAGLWIGCFAVGNFVVVATVSFIARAPRSAVQATAAVAAMQLVLGLWLLSRLHPRNAASPPSLMEQLAYAVPLGASTLGLAIGRQVGHAAVSMLRKPSDYAVYAVGAFEVPFVAIVTGSIMTALLPVFSQLHHEGRLAEILDMWRDSIRKLSLILFPLFWFLMAVSGPLVITLFSERYRASTPVFRIFLLLLPLRTTIHSAILTAAGLTKLVAFGAACFVAGAAVMSVLLIKVMGITGPAVALVLSMYLLGLFYLYHVATLMRVSPARLFPWRQLNMIFLASALPAIPTFALTLLPIPASAAVLVGGVVYCPLCAALLATLRLLTKEEAAAVARLARIWTRRR